LLLVWGCTTNGEREIIRISGSTTVLPVVSRAAELFRLERPNVMITVNAGGSGVGINQVGGGRVDIGMASREIDGAEVGRFAGTEFVTNLIGRDAVAVAVSSEVYDSGVKRLTLGQMRAIYDGTINNWSEVGGFDKAILVIDKEQARGTRHVFMKAVFGDRNAEAAGADLVVGSNNEEQTAIVQSDAAIGMLSMAWLNDDVKGLGVQVGSEVIEPSKENIINGRYPIARGLLLVTNGEPTGIVREFIIFVKGSRGQEVVGKSGYVAIQ